MSSEARLAVGLNAVILAVTNETPRVLTVQEKGVSRADGLSRSPASGETRQDGGQDTLPFGPLDPAADRTLELTLRGWVRERTGLDLGYVEQLYTFGDRDRDPRLRAGDPRILSIAYLALVREAKPGGNQPATWRDIYTFLPWEDWRTGRSELIGRVIEPELARWVDEGTDRSRRNERRVRAGIAFGLGGSGWDGYRALERYELLYEVGLVSEALRDRGLPVPSNPDLPLGRPMALDHRRILATALARVRGKIRYRPVVFELLPPRFTLLQLQRLVEALAGVRLHKQNFRRLVERAGLVEGTGSFEGRTGGRPAELFRFRKGVLLERRTAGVGLPGA